MDSDRSFLQVGALGFDSLYLPGLLRAEASAGIRASLVYAPSSGKFTVDLSGHGGAFAVEWLNPTTGVKTGGVATPGGQKRTSLRPSQATPCYT